MAAANCNGGAELSFVLSNNYPGLYSLVIDPPSGSQQMLDNIAPGPTDLHNLIIIESGTYGISVYNQNIGQACTDSISVVVPEPTPSPMIMLSNIILPSSAGAMDGSFDVVFTSLSEGPYTITINGQEAGQSDGSPFSWTGLSGGDYEVFATDANGCSSNVATVTLSSSTAMRAGWSQTGFHLPVAQAEGPSNLMYVRGAPYVEIDFRRPRQLYRLRLQEWRVPDYTLPNTRALFMSLQYVYANKAFAQRSDVQERDHWSWGNGLALLQYKRGALYWHSTLAWKPRFLEQAQFVAQLYAGKQCSLQIGLDWQW